MKSREGQRRLLGGNTKTSSEIKNPNGSKTKGSNGERKMLVPRFDQKLNFDPYMMHSEDAQLNINNPWNEVLFEVKQLRNYFVD